MSMGEAPNPDAAIKNLPSEPIVKSESYTPAYTETTEELIERSRKAQERVNKLVAAAKTLTSK